MGVSANAHFTESAGIVAKIPHVSAAAILDAVDSESHSSSGQSQLIELEVAAETGEAETETRLFARATPVFAAEQVDGYQPPVIDALAIPMTPIEQAESFVAATVHRPLVAGKVRPSRIELRRRRSSSS
jgi:hypothetical protein